MVGAHRDWPIEARPLGPLALGTLVWRREGVLSVTATAKCTFSMVHEGFALPSTPREIEREERPWMGRKGRSLEAAPEALPALGFTEVTLRGHATAPQREPTSAIAVRLVLWRRSALLDKTLHVFGERETSDAYPREFSTMPLVYERAAGGPGTENPVGMLPEDGAPFIVDPLRPTSPAGFGPRAAAWPGRAPGPPATIVDIWEWDRSVSPGQLGVPIVEGLVRFCPRHPAAAFRSGRTPRRHRCRSTAGCPAQSHRS